MTVTGHGTGIERQRETVLKQRPELAETAREEGVERVNGRSTRLLPLIRNGWRAHPARLRLHRDVVAMIGLVGLLALLWGRGSGVWYWLDEGIAVGISSHPIASIPELLRQDGSPPLYYALLHVWMSLFGSSESLTHLLSLIFALATVPTALWAGWSLFGRRAGWMCALVASVNPFIAYYANETRMYSLVVLLTLFVVATFAHGFVFGRRGHLIGFAASLVLLFYTHNWGLLVGVGCAVAFVALLILASRTERRRTLRDGALAFGAVGLLYLPWLPTLLYQHAAQLQPWAQKPTLFLIRNEVAGLVGGVEGAVALGVGAGVGLATMLRWPWNREGLALFGMAVVPIIVVAGAWATSLFAYRYLAVVVAPLVLLAGAGLARGGRTGVAALAVVAFLTAPIAVKTPPYQKSNAKVAAAQVASALQPGDVVLSPDPQLPPLLSHYLPTGLRYFTTAGPVPDERVVDWRGIVERLQDGDPTRTLPAVLDELPPGAHAVLLCPPTGSPDIATLRQRVASPFESDAVPRTTIGGLGGGDQGDGSSADVAIAPEEITLFHRLIGRRCDETALLVLEHPRLRLDKKIEPLTGITWTPIEGLLLTKLG